MRVLNLYAGIGGNRKLWENVEVTAVEYNEEIAGLYKQFHPGDTVIIGDAHEYLLKHYKEFDFIWSSPPCQTHSKIRAMASARGDYEPKFPDMKLWQEIIFMKWFCRDIKWVVENVIPYYDPLVLPTIELDRHLFWSNFKIRKQEFDKGDRLHQEIKPTSKIFGYDLSGYTLKHRKVQILRNMVNPALGLYILEQAQGVIRQSKTDQIKLFGEDAA
jgi:DNA (cytosine-5)-methyltransferase 1